MMNREKQGKRMAQLIAKCWADEDFKQKLLADPAATLKDEGVELPDGLTIKAVENTDKVFHLVIPAAPGELRDEDLDAVAGGACRVGESWYSSGRRDVCGGSCRVGESWYSNI